MNKKILIPLLIVVLVALCITFIVLCQGDSSPSAGSTATGTIGMPTASDAGSDDEISFEDMLNPDHDADSPMGDGSNDDTPSDDIPPETEGTKPAESTNLDIPDATEGGNDGYSNGWY